MHIIDLTQTITDNMPVYPGTDHPAIELAFTIESNGFEERQLTMVSHTGTHMDAPAHLIKGGLSLDQFDASSFIGTACVLDVREVTDQSIPLSAIEGNASELNKATFALLFTGWDQHWGHERYFQDYPTLTIEAARWLATFNLKGIGMDCLSPDPVGSKKLPVHRVFMERNMVIVENLANLDEVPVGAIFSAMPLKIQDADGSPVRAVAITP